MPNRLNHSGKPPKKVGPLSDEGDWNEGEDNEWPQGESEDEEETTIVREDIDYRRGVTTVMYSNGTYAEVPHETQQSECFIVTACYGSALIHNVVALRSFRDGEVLETRVGRGFLRLFNRFYYAFSPQVASFLSRHRVIRVLVRFSVVSPIVHILLFARFLTLPLMHVSNEIRIFGIGLLFSTILTFCFWLVFMLVTALL